VAGEERNANVVLTADTSGYSQQMVGAAQQTNAVTASVNGLLTSLDKLQKNSARTLTVISASTIAGITAATFAAGKFESQLSSLQARAVVTGQSFENIKGTVDHLRRNLPVTTEQVIQLAGALQKLGTNPSQLRNVAETLMKLSGATGEDLGQLADGMISLQRSMGTGSQGIKQYSDLLLNLSSKMGTAASSVLQFSNAIAPIGRTLNMTQQEIMGFSSAFSKAGQDGLLASNIFTKMLSDISTATRYGTKDLSMYAAIVGKTVDEFKSMGSSNQVAGIFEALNRGGADSIKTLERMGFEGARSLKVIQGTVQTGGINKALGIARDPRQQNGTTLDTSAEAAFGGLNDSITLLKNNVVSLTQAFGSTFLPVFTEVIKTTANVIKMLANALDPFQQIIGKVAVGVAAVTQALSGLISSLGVMATAAAAFMIYRNSMGLGGRIARGTEGAAGWSRRAAANLADPNAKVGMMTRAGVAFGMGRAGKGEDDIRRAFGGREMTPRQVAAFRAGQGAGYVTPGGWIARARSSEFAQQARMAVSGFTGRMPQGDPMERLQQARPPTGTPRMQMAMPRSFGDAARRMAMFGGSVVSGGFGLAASSLDPLRHENVRDITKRGTVGYMAGAGAAGRAGLTGEGASFRAAIGAATGGFKTFGSTVFSATRGIAALGTEAGRAAIKQSMASKRYEQAPGFIGPMRPPVDKGPGAFARIGTGAKNLAAGLGPLGWASIGIGVGTAMYSAGKENDAKIRDSLKADDGINAAYNAYSTSLGLAGQAAQSFADSLLKSTSTVMMTTDEAMKWKTSSINDLTGSKVINQNLKGMTNTGAASYVASAMANSNGDPRVLQAIQRDLQLIYGEDTAQTIWSSAKTGQINFDSMTKSQGLQWKPWETNAKTIQQSAATTDTLDVMRSEMSKRGASDEELTKLTIAAVNARVGDILDAGGKAEEHPHKLALADALGLDPETADFSALKFNTDEVGALFGENKEKARAEMAKQFLIANDRYSAENYEMLTAAEQQSTVYRVGTPEERRNAPDALKQRGTMAGQMFWGTGAAGAGLQAGAFQEGNANANIAASREWAESLIRATGSAAGASDELQKLKGNVGDLSSPISLAATAAQEFALKLQAQQMIGAAPAAGFQNDIRALRGATNAPTTEEYEANYEKAHDAVVARYSEATNMAQNIVKAGRQFEQGRDWNQEDYDLSVARGEEEHRISKERSDSNYEKSRKRSLDAYNLSRKNAEEDFNTSRMRQEVEFNHAKELMARQTAKSMADIYSRVNVQQTWDAQNLVMNAKDQANMFSQQIENLKKLRTMGVSADTIKMLGLNDPRNAQQVARMVQDLQTMPDLVGEFNAAATERLDLGAQFAFDEDNEQWIEMKRSFDLAAEHATEDFEKMAKRGHEAFNLSMKYMAEDYDKMMKQQEADFERAGDNMLDDYNKQLGRSRILFNQQFEAITGDLNDLQTEALGYLGDGALEQTKAIFDSFKGLGNDLTFEADLQAKRMSDAFTKGFINPYSNQKYAPYIGKYVGGGKVDTDSGYGEEDTWASGGSDPSFLTSGPGSPVPGSVKAGTNPLQMYGAARAGGRKHEGSDFPAPTGTAIYAAMPGIAQTKWSPTGGNMTSIDHGNGFWTNYLHQSSYAIRNGERVDQGERIGSVGNTGSASRGAHLHFEVRKGGQWGQSMDPLKWLGITGDMGSSGRAGAYMSDQNIKNWDSFVTSTMKPVEDLTALHNLLTKELPPGTLTAGTIASTHMGLNSMGYLGKGTIFNRASAYGVGERGSELLLPLDAHGADYLADTMAKLAQRVDTRPQGIDHVAASTTNNYEQNYDASINFSGPVEVKADDPNEMARKLEEKARLQRLVTR